MTCVKDRTIWRPIESQVNSAVCDLSPETQRKVLVAVNGKEVFVRKDLVGKREVCSLVEIFPFRSCRGNPSRGYNNMEIYNQIKDKRSKKLSLAPDGLKRMLMTIKDTRTQIEDKEKGLSLLRMNGSVEEPEYSAKSSSDYRQSSTIVTEKDMLRSGTKLSNIDESHRYSSQKKGKPLPYVTPTATTKETLQRIKEALSKNPDKKSINITLPRVSDFSNTLISGEERVISQKLSEKLMKLKPQKYAKEKFQFKNQCKHRKKQDLQMPAIEVSSVHDDTAKRFSTTLDNTRRRTNIYLKSRLRIASHNHELKSSVKLASSNNTQKISKLANLTSDTIPSSLILRNKLITEQYFPTLHDCYKKANLFSVFEKSF